MVFQTWLLSVHVQVLLEWLSVRLFTIVPWDSGGVFQGLCQYMGWCSFKRRLTGVLPAALWGVLFLDAVMVGSKYSSTNTCSKKPTERTLKPGLLLGAVPFGRANNDEGLFHCSMKGSFLQCFLGFTYSFIKLWIKRWTRFRLCLLSAVLRKQVQL